MQKGGDIAEESADRRRSKGKETFIIGCISSQATSALLKYVWKAGHHPLQLKGLDFQFCLKVRKMRAHLLHWLPILSSNASSKRTGPGKNRCMKHSASGSHRGSLNQPVVCRLLLACTVCRALSPSLRSEETEVLWVSTQRR